MSTQHIAALLRATCFVRLATVFRCVCDMLGVVGSSLKMVNNNQQVATDMSQQGGQTEAACVPMRPTMLRLLRWHVAIL